MITNKRLQKLVDAGKACVEDGTDAMLDHVSSRALGEMAEELLQFRPDAKTASGLRHFRRLALGESETLNSDLPDSQLIELEAALRWLDAVLRKA
jgi:hypothetical protein